MIPGLGLIAYEAMVVGANCNVLAT